MPYRSDNWRPGPEVERAHSFEVAFCGDPNCGVHIVALRANHSPICEIVTSAAQTLALIKACKDGLYVKTVERDPE